MIEIVDQSAKSGVKDCGRWYAWSSDINLNGDTWSTTRWQNIIQTIQDIIQTILGHKGHIYHNTAAAKLDGDQWAKEQHAVTTTLENNIVYLRSLQL